MNEAGTGKVSLLFVHKLHRQQGSTWCETGKPELLIRHCQPLLLQVAAGMPPHCPAPLQVKTSETTEGMWKLLSLPPQAGDDTPWGEKSS